ncbi:hypothetical protein BU17DRAFT_88379 [Hysterangium stoloniferum]|nr:hypothetical protein BU17DRAFT_88379 [Hysterangium stoloniferum]
MALQLENIITPTARSRETLILIEHNLATPWLSIVQNILKNSSGGVIVCLCLLHPPADVLPRQLLENDVQRVRIIDWTGVVPGYEDSKNEVSSLEWLVSEVQSVLDNSPDCPVHFFVDSPSTLCDDLESPAQAYKILKKWHANVSERPSPSRMILPVPSQSLLLPLLIPPAFAPAIAHLILHPPSLLLYISTEYLTLPPPHSPVTKFWPLFSGLTSRGEAEHLIWGANGSGWEDETVVEVFIRSATGRKTVDRTLEGWGKNRPCKLEELELLNVMWTKRAGSQFKPEADPTQNLSFNLSLTESQQQSRAQVPLPYAHEGQPVLSDSKPSAIFYDPDSADDIDEDDPDEDLDI